MRYFSPHDFWEQQTYNCNRIHKKQALSFMNVPSSNLDSRVNCFLFQQESEYVSSYRRSSQRSLLPKIEAKNKETVKNSKQDEENSQWLSISSKEESNLC
jgi:hypothetical protein